LSLHEAYEADLVVIGSGVAGSYAALAAAELGAKVVMVTKRGLLSGATPWAQGGIAFPVGPEDIAQHVADTVKAGRGLSDPEVTREILQESLDHLKSLIDKGMRFDPGLAREGGHSRARVMHAGGDRSGLFLLNFLHQHLPSRIKILENRFVFQLAMDDNGVSGAYFLDDSKRVGVVKASATLLATGGSGQLFGVTTNPSEATGDGIALAFRAGCVVRDIELIQFHPTALLDGTLVSEACRGEGAKLVNAAGEYFMGGYYPEAELAPRDVVARAVDSEIKKTGGVFIDNSSIANF
jgi:L-aspartate oxidase